jgi:hypothetical protein
VHPRAGQTVGGRPARAPRWSKKNRVRRVSVAAIGVDRRGGRGYGVEGGLGVDPEAAEAGEHTVRLPERATEGRARAESPRRSAARRGQHAPRGGAGGARVARPNASGPVLPNVGTRGWLSTWTRRRFPAQFRG